VIKGYRRARSARRGQIMVILALAAVGVVGIAALGIDVFYLYWNKNRLQSGTDAAALAGATYLNNVTFTNKDGSCTYATDAQNAACTYALSNGVLLSELTGVVANTANLTMTVSASRSVPALFARIVGIQNFTVSAISVAVLQGLASANNVLPIGLDSLTPYTYGQSINLRMNNCGSGCWQGLAQQSQSYGHTGSAAFQQNLQLGCSCTVNLGDTLTAEPGLKNSAVTNGISARVAAGLASDPSGTWSAHTMDDARVAVLPVVNWGSGCGGGRCTNQVPVTGFAEVWISGTTGGSTINAVFIRQVEPGTPGSSGSNMGAMHAQLTQ
jgi:Flp pilus assembly protein TadG